MRIAEVSAKYGLTPDTLRYYERVGLLPHVSRNTGGIRDYSESDCQRIEFIKCMRSCDMPIETLVEYMKLLDEGDATRSQRIELLKHQRDLMEQHIATLQQGIQRLDQALERSEG